MDLSEDVFVEDRDEDENGGERKKRKEKVEDGSRVFILYCS